MMPLLNFFSWNRSNSVVHEFGKSVLLKGLSESTDPNSYTEEQREKIEKQIRERVAYAIGDIVKTHPFFAGAATKLKYVYTYEVKTAAVDGSHMFINPLFFNGLKTKSIEWVVMHEIMHCMLLHFLRMGMRNHRKWNYATDYEINLIISQELNHYPKNDPGLDGVLYDEGYRGMNAEQIYDKLGDEQQDQDGNGGGGQDDGQGEGQDGQGTPGGSGQGQQRKRQASSIGEVITPEEGKKILQKEGVSENPQIRPTEDEWNKELKEGAKNRQRGAGRSGSPGANLLDDLLSDILKPKVDWRKQLAKYVGSATYREDYRIPSRRHIYKGDIRSAIRSSNEALTNVVFAIDTSGSMAGYAKPVFAELMGILKQDKIKNLIAVYFDAGITGIEKLERGQKPDPKVMKGGGGTLFAPVIEWINKNVKSAELVVIVTDGDNADTDEVTQMRNPRWAKNCIWVVIDSPGKEVPFGKAVYIDHRDL
jgi:predicted metal-dependent peptidase